MHHNSNTVLAVEEAHAASRVAVLPSVVPFSFLLNVETNAGFPSSEELARGHGEGNERKTHISPDTKLTGDDVDFLSCQ